MKEGAFENVLALQLCIIFPHHKVKTTIMFSNKMETITPIFFLESVMPSVYINAWGNVGTT